MISYMTIEYYRIVVGSLEVELPTIWTDGKEEVGRVREGKRREEQKREDQRRERVIRKKMQAREKVEKSRFTVFFQWFVAPEGRKVGSLKQRVEPSGQIERWKIARPCGAKHISKSKCTKHTNIGPFLEVVMSKKWHAAVARSTFPSQNAQSTSASEHFQKLRCRKSARRCGAKHIPKSKCTKTPQLRTPFGSWDVEKAHAVVARSTFRSQECKKLTGSEHFWTFRGRFAWQAQGIVHLVKSEKNFRVL